jgi:IS5 family transposase
MLLVGYVFALRSERRLCSEVQVNLAYRWFCKLSVEDQIPDHSVFCRARHERFRESDALRRVFEGVVAMCIAAGVVGGEAFSVDASLIKADVDKKKRVAGDQPMSCRRPSRHPVRFASTSRLSMPPAAMMRMVVGAVADRAAAAVGGACPKSERAAFRVRQCTRGQLRAPV